jgi:hypothetical protein
MIDIIKRWIESRIELNTALAEAARDNLAPKRTGPPRPAPPL